MSDGPIVELPPVPCATLGYQPPEPPPGWSVYQKKLDGVMYVNRTRKLRAIVSVSREHDGKRWVHLSLSHSARLPTWGELRMAKESFLGDVYAYQVIPPQRHYVNVSPNVLHLFHCLDGAPLPEFSRGKGTL